MNTAFDQDIRDQVHDYLTRKWPWDRVSAIADAPQPVFDRAAWLEIAQLGWLSLDVPAKLGGLELGLAAAGGLAEELGASIFPGPFFATAGLALPFILHDDRLAGEVLAGRASAGLAQLPGDAGADTAGAASATRTPHGWQVSGQGLRLLSAGLVDHVVVVASTPGGPAAFVLDTAATGVSSERAGGLDGTRRSADLVLASAPARLIEIPNLAGTQGVAERRALILAAFEAVGVARRALDLTAEYVKLRMAFGRPIGGYQAVAHPLADAYVAITLSRALALWAARMHDSAHPRADLAARAAKATAAVAAVSTCETAIQAHGAIGAMWEHPLHRLYRRAQWAEAFGGRAPAHRAVIAATLLGQPGVAAGVPTTELYDNRTQAAFRSEVRAWVERHRFTPDQVSDSLREYASYERHRAQWARHLLGSGYLTLSWPREHGGSGASPTLTGIFLEEAIRTYPRRWQDRCGFEVVAPTILAHGTDQQKQSCLQGIRTGREIWTQGFSEPDAGTDLAALRTRARHNGDHYRVSGEKTWSSYAQQADRYFLLVRTDPDATRHRGLTVLLTDLSLPGITISPIRSLTGVEEVCAVHLDDVRVPESDRLGDEGDGWRVAMAQLEQERTTTMFEETAVLLFISDRLLEAAAAAGVGRRAAGEQEDSVFRDQLAQVWCTLTALQLVNRGVVDKHAVTGELPDESTMTKLVWSQLSQELSELGMAVCGVPATDGTEVPGNWFWRFLRLDARTHTLFAGTTEIMRSVIAETVLGLPRSR